MTKPSGGAVGPSGGRYPEWTAGTARTTTPPSVTSPPTAISRTFENPAAPSHGPEPDGTKIRQITADFSQRRDIKVVPVEMRDEDGVDVAEAVAFGDRFDPPQGADARPRDRIRQQANPSTSITTVE